MTDDRLPEATAKHKFRDRTHAGAIEAVTRVPWAPKVPGEKLNFVRPLPPGLWIEVGSGASTPWFAAAREHYRNGHDAAPAITIDFNGDHVPTAAQMDAVGARLDVRVGDSRDELDRIRTELLLEELDGTGVAFAFLDGSPDSLTTFQEFEILEGLFPPGGIVLIDNCLPPWVEPRHRITQCAKGFLTVAYLLSHPDWRVHPCPWWGDSMTWAEFNPGGKHLTRKVRAFDLFQSEIDDALGETPET